MKRCIMCDEEKLLTEFRPQHRRCKICTNKIEAMRRRTPEYVAKRRARETSAEYRAYQRAYYSTSDYAEKAKIRRATPEAKARVVKRCRERAAAAKAFKELVGTPPEKVKRKAPKQGYNFPEKQEYRDQVWGTLLDGVNAAAATVLILPSTEGAEIPLLLALGVQEEHIIAVDESAALIATAPWRKAHPKVRCYGNELGRACERMAKDGLRVDIANLDLCSPIASPLIATLRSTFSSGALARDAKVALTMLKGREDAELMMLYREDGAEDRLEYAFKKAKPGEFSRIASGEYKSSTQVMQWGAIQRHAA